jgi:hypothetical protein
MNTTQPKCPFSNRNRPKHHFAESACCIGSVLRGEANVWLKNRCVDTHDSKINYKFKLKYPNNRRAFNMADIFWSLKNRSTVLLLGDSVLNQVYDALTCDLKRNGIQLIGDKDMNMQLYVENWNETTMAKPKTGADYKQTRGQRHNRTFIAYKQHNNNNNNNYSSTTAHVINFVFFRIYRPYLPHYQWFCKWAEVYLINWDLHYRPYSGGNRQWQTEIGDGILQLIQSCFDSQNNSNQIFIWRGTTAQ